MKKPGQVMTGLSLYAVLLRVDYSPHTALTLWLESVHLLPGVPWRKPEKLEDVIAVPLMLPPVTLIGLSA